MSETSDAGTPGSWEDEGGLDPHEAARLLTDSRRRAQRALDFRSSLLSVIAAMVALVGFGVVWLTVREQHPYTGPTAASLVVLYVLVAIRIGTVLYAQSRASAGVTGRSIGVRRAEGAAAAVALLAVYVLMAALVHDGGRHPSFYWVYGVTATVIVLGTFWAARCAVREDWLGLGVSIVTMLVAAGSALAGPRGMWLGDGAGFCIVLLGHAAIQAWLAHTSRSGG